MAITASPVERDPSANVAEPDPGAGPGVVTRFLVSVSLALLLFSSLGPLLDHHFAERIPHHVHAFVGQNGLHHEHSFQEAHVHYSLPADAAGHNGGNSAFSGVNGIIYLTPDDGLRQNSAPIATTTYPASGVFPDLHSGLHEFALVGENKILQSWKAPPLKKPPQV